MSCDLCGGTSKPLRVFPAAHVCDSCALVFVPERRSAEEIAQSWEHVYEGGYDPQWPGVQARLYYVVEWLNSKFDLSGRNLLDIGAGDGSFLAFAFSHGAEVSGIEPSRQNIAKWTTGMQYRGAWEDCKYLWGSKFHFVTINWTLENCGDPLGMLKFAAEHAEYVSVATGSRILVPFKKPFTHYITGNEEPDLHAYRWSRKSLEFAFWRVGLEVINENDWLDRDEMILVGRKGNGRRPETDDPEDVQDYFEQWSSLWP